jgi:phosphomevalonate kinase
VAELAGLAGNELGAFLPSGAGGGDVAVYLGIAPPSGAFLERALRAGLTPLALGVEPLGLRASGDQRPAMIYEGARHP